tara:strand:+ start:132 stop:431 length:300 start_codon:yes stop_codon:yes gene_type:complete
METWERILKLFMGDPVERKYCNLNSIINFEMDSVNIYKDKHSLIKNVEPKSVYVFYKGEHVATAYQDHIDKISSSYSDKEDQNKLEKLFSTLDSFYSVY